MLESYNPQMMAPKKKESQIIGFNARPMNLISFTCSERSVDVPHMMNPTYGILTKIA